LSGNEKAAPARVYFAVPFRFGLVIVLSSEEAGWLTWADVVSWVLPPVELAVERDRVLLWAWPEWLSAARAGSGRDDSVSWGLSPLFSGLSPDVKELVPADSDLSSPSRSS